jgi:hypothetical protein
MKRKTRNTNKELEMAKRTGKGTTANDAAASEATEGTAAPEATGKKRPRKDQRILVLIRNEEGTTVQADGETFFDVRKAMDFAETLEVEDGSEVLLAPIQRVFGSKTETVTRLTEVS